MDVDQTRQYPKLKMFISNKEKVSTIEKSAANLGLVLQQLMGWKINTAGTDENLFRLVPVHGHGQVPSTTSRASARARHCAQISAPAPEKAMFRPDTRTGTKSERGLRYFFFHADLFSHKHDSSFIFFVVTKPV